MSRFSSFASLAPSKSSDAYITCIIPIAGNGLAAITSALGETLLIDRENLASSKIVRLDDSLRFLTCLALGDAQGQSIICSDADGTIATFDVRTQKKVSSFKLDKWITAIDAWDNRVLVGTDFKSQQAIVSLWDNRQNKQVWQNSENSDDITVVALHPTRPNVVLAGGDDGLVSLYDTNIVEEEDSLVQVINHGPIHKAGFLGNDRVYALSSDQDLAVHPVSSPGEEEDPEPIRLGDLRPIVPCQYVVDVVRSGQDYVIAAGKNIDESRLDLVKLDNAIYDQPRLDVEGRHILEPAHGEEIVRSIFVDDQAGVVFTAGEDGHIRAFRQSEAVETPKSSKSSKKKETSEQRYKPY